MLTEPWPLLTIWRRAARSAAEGIDAVGPVTEPMSIDMSGLPGSSRSVTTATIAAAVGLPPEVVDHDIDVCGGLVETVCDGGGQPSAVGARCQHPSGLRSGNPGFTAEHPRA